MSRPKFDDCYIVWTLSWAQAAGTGESSEPETYRFAQWPQCSYHPGSCTFGKIWSGCFTYEWYESYMNHIWIIYDSYIIWIIYESINAWDSCFVMCQGLHVAFCPALPEATALNSLDNFSKGLPRKVSRHHIETEWNSLPCYLFPCICHLSTRGLPFPEGLRCILTLNFWTWSPMKEHLASHRAEIRNRSHGTSPHKKWPAFRAPKN